LFVSVMHSQTNIKLLCEFEAPLFFLHSPFFNYVVAVNLCAT
jgi:hypothetical protein